MQLQLISQDDNRSSTVQNRAHIPQCVETGEENLLLNWIFLSVFGGKKFYKLFSTIEESSNIVHRLNFHCKMYIDVLAATWRGLWMPLHAHNEKYVILCVCVSSYTTHNYIQNYIVLYCIWYVVYVRWSKSFDGVYHSTNEIVWICVREVREMYFYFDWNWFTVVQMYRCLAVFNSFVY